MKKLGPVLIVPVLIIAAVTAWRLFFKQEIDPNMIRVSGNIEATDVQLGFKIPGRLEQCFVDEGDAVPRGGLVAQLENEDQKIGLDLAQAQVRKAQQVVLELTRGSRSQEIETAKADLETAMAAAKSAQAQLVNATEDYERFSILYKGKNATQRDFELYRTRYEIARNDLAKANAIVHTARQALSLRREGPRTEQIERAKADLAQAEAEYTLVKAGPRQEKIDQAKALLAQAEHTLNQAKQQLSYTRLFAPMAGIILSRSAEPGEYLNPSTPVVTLGDLDHPWVRAFINEKDLGRIRLKDKVLVTVDSFPDKHYTGILSFISSQAEFTPKSVQTFEERVKLMFRIKITLSNPEGELKPGMPADAFISLSDN
jgi:HlyD family secretion protein